MGYTFCWHHLTATPRYVAPLEEDVFSLEVPGLHRDMMLEPERAESPLKWMESWLRSLRVAELTPI